MKLITLEDALVDTFCSPIWPSFALCQVNPHELAEVAATYNLFILALDGSSVKSNFSLGIIAGFGKIDYTLKFQSDSLVCWEH